MPTLFAHTESGFTAEQSAGSKLDYGLDWSDFMATAPGDRIVTSTWTPEDSSVVCSNAAIDGAVTSVWITGGAPGQWYAIVNEVVTEQGRKDSRVCLLYVRPASSGGSALFPSRLVALAKLRRDRLLAAAGVTPGTFADEYLWDKLRAAEAEVQHTLRVPLAPTKFFPVQPTQEEIDALGGMPWGIDPGYDLGPENNAGDRWGMIATRQKPIIDIQRYRFAYPAVDSLVYDVPLSWLRPDKKYGYINVVPSSFSISVPLSVIVMQALSAGRTVPLMLQVTYTAGLENAARDYPELVDVVYKLAVVKCIEDRFLPQSASVSADGLSQSMSIDMDKYRDTIEHTLNGGKGSNGGLMAAIHGVRAMVF